MIDKLKLILICSLTVVSLDLLAQNAVPKPFVFGHDKDIPLAASVIGAADFLFMDWDSDGDNDMLTTGRGGFALIENIGSKKKPKFNNVFKHDKVLFKDARIGRFFSVIRHSGVKTQQNLASFIAFERHEQISDAGKKQLGLHMFIPVRLKDKTTWQVIKAFDVKGKPIQKFLDSWVSPTIDVADLNGDGKEDLIVGSSHPRIAQPSLNFAAGFNNPQDSWNPNASRLYIMYNRSTADSLIFDEPQVIEADNSPISPYGFPYPIAFDIDNDGLKDLIVGQHKPGILYFRNTGTKEQPKFSFVRLLTDQHQAPILSIHAIHPRFADMDGDGKPELLASTYFGCVDNILQFTQKNGGWTAQGPLMMASDKDSPLMPLGIGTIEAIDWDGDGDIDMVVGSEPSAPKVIINTGSNAKPIWAIPEPLKFVDGSAVEYYSIDRGLGSVWGPMEWYLERVLPRLADWDGDGIRDLLTGSMGLRQLILKGRIVKGELRFEKPVVFKVGGEPLAAGQRVQPGVWDFNADGHLDLIAMDDQNVVKLWPGKGTDELGQSQTFFGHDGKPLQIKTRILDIGHGRCQFALTDWDLDGRPDLIVYYGFDRKRGGIYYYKASAKPMQFEKPVKLSNMISFHEGGISLADWDGDGYLDIFTGGDNGHIRKEAVPRGKLFLLSGKDLPVPPAIRKSEPITITTKQIIKEQIYKTTVWAENENKMFAHFVYGLTVTDKGSILALAEARIDTGLDDGAHHIVLKRSTDKGQSFSESKIIVESTKEQSWTNPTVLQDRITKEIFLFYALNHKNESTQVYFKTSKDDGISWSAASEITSLFVTNAHGWTFHLPGPGHGIQLKNGRLIIPVWHRKSISFATKERKYGVNCVYSDDHGKTWKVGGDTPVGELNESQIVEQKDGDLLLIGRTVTGSSDSHQAKVWSKDKGLTWTQKPEYDTALSGKMCDIGLISYSLKSGVMLVSQPSDLKKRMNLTIRLSMDEGKTWAVSKLLEEGGATYSDLAILPDKSIICLYGNGGTKHMPQKVSLARFDLQWLQ